MSIWYRPTSPLCWGKDREGGGSRKDQWGRALGPRFPAQAQALTRTPVARAPFVNSHKAASVFSHADSTSHPKVNIKPPHLDIFVLLHGNEGFCMWIHSRLQKLSFFQASLTIRIFKPWSCNRILVGKTQLKPLQNAHRTRRREKNRGWGRHFFWIIKLQI